MNPFNAQNHNRYSYCLNSPLRYTDPSGYYFSRVENLAPRMDVIPFFHDPMLYSRIGGGGGGSFYPNTSDGYTDWVTGGTTADMVAHAWNSTPDGGIMSYFYTNGRLDFSYAGMAISGVEVTGSWDNGRWHTSSVRYPDGWGGVAEGHGDELATASTIFGAVGVAGDVTSMSNSTFRIMSGANGTFSLKIYNSGWNGGSPAKITTYSLSKVGTGVSTGASVVTTYISYNQIYNGEALPITYVDAGVGTAGILAAGASYFYGVQIPVVGEFVAVYGALRLTWDVSFYLGTQYGPSKWYGTNDNKWFK